MMSTKSSQTYLVSVLRRLEGRLAEKSCRDRSMTVARLARRLSTTGDIEKELERLYCVKGLDRFALGLMWVASTLNQNENGGQTPLMENHADLLDSLLESAFDGKPLSLGQIHTSVRRSECLEETLYRFGRSISDASHKAAPGGKFVGVAEDLLYLILKETGALRDNASTAGRREIVRFCAAFSDFLEQVINRALLKEPRVLNIMENANITLQTAIAGWGWEEDESLEQTTLLLEQSEFSCHEKIIQEES